MDNELHKETIKIDSIEDKEKLVIIHSGKSKFKVWKIKTDGKTPTKAYTQLKDFKLSAGEMIAASFKVEDREYNGRDYKERTIMFFDVDDGGAPKIKEGEKKFEITEAMWEDLLGRVDFLELGTSAAKDEINPNDLPF